VEMHIKESFLKEKFKVREHILKIMEMFILEVGWRTNDMVMDN